MIKHEFFGQEQDKRRGKGQYMQTSASRIYRHCIESIDYSPLLRKNVKPTKYREKCILEVLAKYTLESGLIDYNTLIILEQHVEGSPSLENIFVKMRRVLTAGSVDLVFWMINVVTEEEGDYITSFERDEYDNILVGIMRFKRDKAYRWTRCFE